MRLVIEIHFDDGTPTATVTEATALAGPTALTSATAAAPATSPPFTPVDSTSMPSDGGSPLPIDDDPEQA